jgi:hypothetical protein
MDHSIDEIVPFIGLRLEIHTILILQHQYLDHFKDFVQKLVQEQPHDHDRPSDVDVKLLRCKNDNNFLALTDLLAPVLHDIDVANIVVGLLSHHIDYTCNLFFKTDYNPGERVVRSLSEWRVNQVSMMVSEPLCRISLHAWIPCAKVNTRGVQDFVHQKARALFEYTSPKLPNWELHAWFLGCLECIILATPSMMPRSNGDNYLQAIADPSIAPIENFVPTNTARLRIPDSLLEVWQPYDADPWKTCVSSQTDLLSTSTI